MVEDFGNLVDDVREHYLEQFLHFVEKEKRNCTRGMAEVKLGGFEAVDGLYRNVYCIDFVGNDGQLKLIEWIPDRYLSFDRFVAYYERLTLRVEDLRWDDVVMDHDLETLPADAVAAWFDRWYGSDTQKTNMIHSLVIKPRYISVDFGTAPSDALFEMIDLLEKAGVKSLQMRSGRAKLSAH
jgi:hypothetical protein